LPGHVRKQRHLWWLVRRSHAVGEQGRNAIVRGGLRLPLTWAADNVTGLGVPRI
jgi:hypothetical protein